jgi:hypothetical protein
LSPKSTTFVAGTGNQFVVTYTFSPQNGQWGAADTGVWSIEVVEEQVGDGMTKPKYVPPSVLGTFTVTSKDYPYMSLYSKQAYLQLAVAVTTTCALNRARCRPAILLAIIIWAMALIAPLDAVSLIAHRM